MHVSHIAAEVCFLLLCEWFTLLLPIFSSCPCCRWMIDWVTGFYYEMADDLQDAVGATQ
jgi:hypothetical protein